MKRQAVGSYRHGAPTELDEEPGGSAAIDMAPTELDEEPWGRQL